MGIYLDAKEDVLDFSLAMARREMERGEGPLGHLLAHTYFCTKNQLPFNFRLCNFFTTLICCSFCLLRVVFDDGGSPFRHQTHPVSLPKLKFIENLHQFAFIKSSNCTTVLRR